MVYSKKFSEKKYEVITEVLSKLERLPAGGKVTVSGLDREALGRVRYLLYDWFSHMGLKKKYRLRMDYPANELTIQHVAPPEGMSVRVEGLATVRDDLMRELIDNEERAEELVAKWETEKVITKDEGERLLLALAQVLS